MKEYMQMKKQVILAVLLAATGVAFAGEAGAKAPFTFKYEGNPLVRHISSTDPDAHVWDGEVWVYTSQDHAMQPGDEHEYVHMDGYHVFSSRDLVNWTDHGEIMHSRDIPWSKGGWLWAPGAARKDGKYFLYYPIKDPGDTWRIGVAIGDTPAGPFKDIGHPIAGTEGIDPAVFIDDDGQAYLYCGDAWVAKLKPNMTELAEPLRRIDYAPAAVTEDKLRKSVEGTYMHKRNGIYYFSYVNPHNPVNQGYYGMGKSPYGPFEWKGVMAHPAGPQFHHSVVEFKGQWYDFYHVGGNSRKPAGYKGVRRLAVFDKLYYNDDGTIRMLEQTGEK
jgi:arabinoxylan arabinofuranohydrolase